MDTQALNHPPAEHVPRPPKRRSRRPAIVMVLLVLVWAGLFFFRMELRAHWWAYRLARAESPEARRYYQACLVAVGDKSLGAADRLLRDPRPEIRGMGVAVLERCPSERATESLLGVLFDEDENVAVQAALALASREAAPAAAERVRGDLVGPDGASARRAAVVLQRIGGTQARQMLIDALGRTTDPDVRAQLIDSLGVLGVEQAVGPLIDLLDDERPVRILPYAQRSALRALGALQGQLQKKGIDTRDVGLALQAETTVASVADRSLRLITGVTFGPPATRPAGQVDVVRRQWRQWWHQQTTLASEPATRPSPP